MFDGAGAVCLGLSRGWLGRVIDLRAIASGGSPLGPKNTLRRQWLDGARTTDQCLDESIHSPATAPRERRPVCSALPGMRWRLLLPNRATI